MPMTTVAICATREVSWWPSYYRGEQYDPDLGLYYLRARYYNPATGRFLSRDPEDGKASDPASLHKYLYANGDPVNGVDRTGRADAYETAVLIVTVSIAARAAVKLFVTSEEQGYKMICLEIAGFFAEVPPAAAGLGVVCAMAFP